MSAKPTDQLAGSADLAIVVTDLVKRYGTVVAVDHVSLDVRAGEIFGLLGPNGAGKTTTLETLVGLREQDSGSVRVAGLDLPRQRQPLKARIGVQLQTTALPRYLNAREVLELFSAFYPRHRPIPDVLKAFGFEERKLLKTPARYLSVGQQRRLALATATLHDPEVLFLDEPTAGLDPQARRVVWDLLAERRRLGQTTFLTTHDMHEAECICDRVAIIDHGRLLAIGQPAALARRASAEHAIWVQWDGPPLAIGEVALPGVERFLRQEDGLLLYSSDVPQTLAALMSASDSRPVESIQIRPPSLEDLFLQLTGRSIRA